MRIGLVARADTTGLAVQAWSFWRNMKPDVTLVVDLSRFGHKCEPERYGGHGEIMRWEAPHFLHEASAPEQILDDFLEQVDCVFTIETPYNYWLFDRALELDVRTVVQPNYEFFDYSGGRRLPRPDLMALPTNWHEEDYRREMPSTEVRVVPVPVDTELLPWERRTELRSILHTAGTVAQPDRNGTAIFLEAMRLVTAPVTARVCYQPKYGNLDGHEIPPNVVIDTSAPHHYWELYGDEDAYVMPRRFGGLCLPLQESMACGMVPVMSNVAPQNEVLDQLSLVDASISGSLASRVPIDMVSVDPQALADRIDYLYNHPEHVERISDRSLDWADAHSWESLKPLYAEILCG